MNQVTAASGGSGVMRVLMLSKGPGGEGDGRGQPLFRPRW
jgi:hypothetical protein